MTAATRPAVHHSKVSSTWSSALAEQVLDACRQAGLRVATAESCTGGMVAAALTDIAGSSDVVERGFVTYSDEAKAELLGIPPETIVAHGAVSEPVARAMAEGALGRSQADIAVGITGIAGPRGGSAEKPVGLVYLASSRRGGPTLAERHVYEGDRAEIRRHATVRALQMLRERSGEAS